MTEVSSSSSTKEKAPSEMPLSTPANNVVGSGPEFERPFIFKWIPYPLKWESGPNAATGLTVNMFGRAAYFLSGVFIGPGLLTLAWGEALEDCPNPAEDPAGWGECYNNAEVYGFKPSSLLTNISTIGGICAALGLPIAGAIMDHTHYRRQVGMTMAVILILIKVAELILMNEDTWFALAILQIFKAVIFYMHVTTLYAYSSELSDDAKVQSNYQSYFYRTMFVGMIIYMFEVLLPSRIIQGETADNVQTARFAMGFAILMSLPCFFISWYFFLGNRPPLSRVPEGRTLLTTGFIQLWNTSKMIKKELPDVGYFLIALLFSEAADAAFPLVAVTYLNQYLGFDAIEIGYIIAIILAGGYPGAWFGSKLSTKVNPINSIKICLAFDMGLIVLQSLTLGPENKNLMYFYAVLWGLGQGWLHPQHAAAYIAMTPTGQESELMGIFLFTTQLLVFMFPMLFTIFNEAGIEMNWALQTLNFGYVIAFIFFSFVRDFDGAVAHAQSKSAAKSAVTEVDSVDLQQQAIEGASADISSGDEGIQTEQAENKADVLVSPMIEHGV